MSTIAVDNAQPSGGGTEYSLTAGVAKAVATYDQTGTPSVRKSENIASFTDNGSGDATLGITNNFTDIDGAAAGVIGINSSTGSAQSVYERGDQRTTSAIRLLVSFGSGGLTDRDPVHIVVMGDLS